MWTDVDGEEEEEDGGWWRNKVWNVKWCVREKKIKMLWRGKEVIQCHGISLATGSIKKLPS